MKAVMTLHLKCVCSSLILSLLALSPVWGQVRSAAVINGDCDIAAVHLKLVREAGGGCTTAAVSIMAELLPKLRKSAARPQPTGRILQSTRAEGAVPTGTPGQAEAVPGVQPTAAAAASLSAVGTDSGSKAIVAISLNPATLFGGTDSATVAKWSRVADFTLLVPMSKESPGAASVAGLRYLGVRGKLNLSGISVGESLLSRMNPA